MAKESSGLRFEGEEKMPAKSAAQYKFMAGVTHGMKPRKSTGPSEEVAEEFVQKTPASKRKLWMKKKK
jgi:hypothetical protein